MSFVHALACAFTLCAATLQEPSGATFYAHVDAGAVPELRDWIAAHPGEAFGRATGLVRAWSEERSDPDRALGHRARVAAARRAFEPGGTAELLSRPLAWTAPQWEQFARGLELANALEVEPGGPHPDRVRTAQEALDALGAAPFRLRPFTRIVGGWVAAERTHEAEELVRWIAARAEDAGDAYSLSWARSWLGRHLWRSGRIEQAAVALRGAVRVERGLGESPALVATLVEASSIGLVLGELGTARSDAEEAVELARRIGDAAGLAQALETVASAALELGELQQALAISLSLAPALEESEAAAREPRPVDPQALRVDLLASRVLADVGRLESAWTYARRALAGAEDPELFAQEPGLCAEVWLHAGLLLGDLDRTDEGLAQLARARAAFEAEGDPRGVGWAQKDRGWILLRRGEYDAARRSFEDGLRVGSEVGSTFLEAWSALGAAESLMLATPADAPLDASQASAANRLASIAAAAQRELRDPHLAWRLHALAAHAARHAGRFDEALEQYAACIEGIERWRRRASAPGLATHFLRDKADPYREAALLAARRGRPADALAWSELLRARTRLEGRRRRSGPLDTADDDRVSTLRVEAAELAARLRRTDLLPTEHATLEERWRASVARLDTALLDAELRAGGLAAPSAEQHGEDGASRGDPARTPRTEFADVRTALARAGLDAGLAYLVDADATLVFCVTPTGEHVEVLPVGRAWLAERVDALRAPIDELHRGELDLFHLGFDASAARELYDALVRPFEDELGEHVALVTDDVLARVPFELFVTGGAAAPVDPRRPFAHLRGLRFLGLERSLRYVGALNEPGAPVRPALPGTGTDQVRVFAPAAQRDLDSAHSEVAAIRQAFGDRVDVRAGASAQDVRRLAAGPALLHLIAHGATDPTYPLHGHLRFGGAAQDRLEAWEVEDLVLDARLVVLSACETARGAWYPGEGLVGLTRSFLVAGCDAVVASQWVVEERATAAFMGAFYAALAAGEAPDRALRSARRALAKSDDERGFARAHPYFFCAWVAVR